MSVNETLSKKVYRTLKTIDGSGNKTWNKLAFWTTADQVELENGDNAQSVLESIMMRNTTIYVSPTGSDMTGTGSNSYPFATISMALSKIPKNLNGYEVNIYVANGTYTDNITIKGFHGGRLIINLFTNGTVTLNGYINIESASEIMIRGADANLIINNTVKNGGMHIDANSSVKLIQILLTVNGSMGTSGIFVNGHSSLYVDSGAFTANNCFAGIMCLYNSECHTPTIAGSGNMNGIIIDSGGKVSYGTNSISATTQKVITAGGIITNDLVTKSQIGSKVIVSATAPSDTSAVWVY